jgi:hypothetical protein
MLTEFLRNLKHLLHGDRVCTICAKAFPRELATESHGRWFCSMHHEAQWRRQHHGTGHALAECEWCEPRRPAKIVHPVIATALILGASQAYASDLPPCHPMFPPGMECQMPAIPPPGGVLPDPSTVPAPLSACRIGLAEGTPCIWIHTVDSFDFFVDAYDDLGDVAYSYRARAFIATRDGDRGVTAQWRFRRVVRTDDCTSDFPPVLQEFSREPAFFDFKACPPVLP